MVGFYYINNGKNLYKFDILRKKIENFKPIFVPLLKRQKTNKILVVFGLGRNFI